MIGVALLGAGIFAQEQHLPAIEACSLYNLKAVYSRSQKSADALAAKSRGAAETYFDSPTVAGRSLADLLARDDITAVIVCLPILTQPEVIKKALQAGKHVLSEKPIAGDAAAAEALTKWHVALPGAPIWAVAENFRFMKTLEMAADTIKEIGGELVTFHLSSSTLVKEDNRFWNTEWRKVPSYQGGFLLDGGIHSLAGLRLLLGAAGQEIGKVACFSALQQPRLLPVDTVRAVAATGNGASGLVSLSFGTEFKRASEIEIVTTEGRVTWSPNSVKSVSRSSPAEESYDVEREDGIVAEFEAFSKSIGAGAVNPLQSSDEGLKDLRLLEALLRSGEAGAAVRTVEH